MQRRFLNLLSQATETWCRFRLVGSGVEALATGASSSCGCLGNSGRINYRGRNPERRRWKRGNVKEKAGPELKGE